MKRITLFIIVNCLCSIAIFGQIRLPQLVRDSMVLQRDAKVNIWGWASAGENISASFNGKKYQAKADANGQWIFQLAPMKAGGPYTMELAGKNKIVLKDI
ncbi:MAG: sialate O-acetylesterase, partial [Sediminibacterium sp.]